MWHILIHALVAAAKAAEKNGAPARKPPRPGAPRPDPAAEFRKSSDLAKAGQLRPALDHAWKGMVQSVDKATQDRALATSSRGSSDVERFVLLAKDGRLALALSRYSVYRLLPAADTRVALERIAGALDGACSRDRALDRFRPTVAQVAAIARSLAELREEYARTPSKQRLHEIEALERRAAGELSHLWDELRASLPK
jgi:hypothetical protein